MAVMNVDIDMTEDPPALPTEDLRIPPSTSCMALATMGMCARVFEIMATLFSMAMQALVRRQDVVVPEDGPPPLFSFDPSAKRACAVGRRSAKRVIKTRG